MSYRHGEKAQENSGGVIPVPIIFLANPLPGYIRTIGPLVSKKKLLPGFSEFP